MSYKCEIEGCGWTGAIRSKVKNKDSEYYGKKVCPAHAKELNNYLDSTYDLRRAPIKPSRKDGLWEQNRKRIKRMTDKTRQKKKEQSEIRDAYFEHHLLRCKHSEESGTPIPFPTRANICHIFPKRRYKSVQGHIDNCIYLTLEEHTRFDQLLDIHDFETLEKEFNCWNQVITRVKSILHLVEERSGKLLILLEAYIKEKENA